MRRTESIGIRVTNDVKAAAIDAAEGDNRSVASLVEKLLIDYLISDGYLKAKHDDRHHKKSRLEGKRESDKLRLPLPADSD